MALRVAVVMASINGACKECPYEKECNKDCNVKQPDDALCEIWQREKTPGFYRNGEEGETT